jgi:hypothetical protein
VLLVGAAWAVAAVSGCGGGVPSLADAAASGAAGASADAAFERASDLRSLDRLARPDRPGALTDASPTAHADALEGDGGVDAAPAARDGLEMARCFDGVQNGDESDVDCGGDRCSPCLPFWGCRIASDCLGMSCDPTTKRCRPSCTDGFMDGDETDVDCGGSCPKCRVHRDCSSAFDCTTDMCGFWDHGNHCLPFRTCSDGIRDVGETDIDCGGPYCARCEAGQACVVDADCATSCAAGVCA